MGEWETFGKLTAAKTGYDNLNGAAPEVFSYLTTKLLALIAAPGPSRA